MPLATSHTLNVGTPAVDIIYGSLSHLDGNAVLYYAPSAQSDLIGRPTLRVSSETTKQGIERTLTSFSTPYHDGTAYDGFVKADFVLNRHGKVPLTFIERELEKMADFLSVAANRTALAQASIA